LAHIKHTAKNGTNQAIDFQLLEFDIFTGWNWRGSTAPSTTILYGLDPDKYYLWYDTGSNDFIPDVDPVAGTLPLGSTGTTQLRKKCNCILCNVENKWAEPNMTLGRFMCFSCRSTDKWRYDKGEYL
jgi:hypothetical protein